MSHRYLLVSPCRNEAAHCHRTLQTVVGQSIKPALWVIVDDGSSDTTPQILAEYAQSHRFIRVLRAPDRGTRSVGPGVIEAFNAGYATVDATQFDFVCKLDMDLALPPTYFEQLMRRMALEPRIGTCSGKPYFLTSGGALVSEAIGDEMSAGMTKFYRRECFEEIGGFVQGVMWDGIDCHRCRMRGWIACSWDDPELRFLHLRPMGSSHRGMWTGRKRHGQGQWFMGTGLLYMLVSAAYRMSRRPRVVGGLGMLVGYLSAMLKRLPRYPDPEFRDFLRSHQWRCLLYGKRRATALIHERLGGSPTRDHVEGPSCERATQCSRSMP
ncbi:MAG TPA: glycosyltransferase family A protein [Planctomycetota bacterium]